jgi:RHS repeat-associated protein
MAAQARTVLLCLAAVCLPAFANVPKASLLSEKPRLGAADFALASHQGLAAAKPLTAPGIARCLCDEGRRSRSTGKERDAETGVDYFGARYFASGRGTWLAADVPFADQFQGIPQSWNLYTYVRNNPAVFTDPDGVQTDPCTLVYGSCTGPQSTSNGRIDRKSRLNAEEEAVVKTLVGCLFGPLGCILNPVINPPGVGDDSKPPTLGQVVVEEGIGLAIGVVLPGGGKAANQTGKELISSIKKDKTLTKLAEEAGQSVQAGLDSLTKQLAGGNLNPGIGTKKLFGNISYARARDGARVFFRRVGDQIDVLAKASKENEVAVIKQIEKLYRGK